MNRSRPPLLPTLLVMTVVGCQGTDDGVREPVADDTASAFEGVSPDEIRLRAEPMSPEVAESLGIVDTTIHVEERLSDDTLPAPPPEDSTR